ncbi:MAG: hypothetical protein M1827_003038 [Pycnora praestabilis]|nr:MAG: hypothetical protein M1827_003038 [Pycnora praestabilis]
MDTLAAIRTSFDSDHSQPRALSHGRGGAGTFLAFTLISLLEEAYSRACGRTNHKSLALLGQGRAVRSSLSELDIWGAFRISYWYLVTLKGMLERSKCKRRAAIQPTHFSGSVVCNIPRPLAYLRAGNMKRGSKDFTEPDLVTPTIKTDVYTTGRGGTGNMAKNDPLNPELARESQDVNGLPRRQSEAETHFGRGGAANTVKPSEEEIAMAKEEKVGWEKKVKEQQQQPVPKDKADPKVPKEQRDVRGWADKGKDMLFGKNRRGSKG